MEQPSEGARRSEPHQHFDLRLLASRTEMIPFCCLNHSVCATFGYSGPSKTYRSEQLPMSWAISTDFLFHFLPLRLLALLPDENTEAESA